MHAEAIYKGATRPAMKFGVPLVPLVILVGGGALVTIWGGALLSWWIALFVAVAAGPLLMWMRYVTAKDDQRFHQMFLATKLHLPSRNRRFWHTRSYSPTVFRGTRDAWQA